jgi:hypothetical protein
VNIKAGLIYFRCTHWACYPPDCASLPSWKTVTYGIKSKN